MKLSRYSGNQVPSGTLPAPLFSGIVVSRSGIVTSHRRHMPLNGRRFLLRTENRRFR